MIHEVSKFKAFTSVPSGDRKTRRVLLRILLLSGFISGFVPQMETLHQHIKYHDRLLAADERYEHFLRLSCNFLIVFAQTFKSGLRPTVDWLDVHHFRNSPNVP